VHKPLRADSEKPFQKSRRNIKSEKIMKELEKNELVEINGGKIGLWLTILDAISDYAHGFADGYNHYKETH